jgi:hypothetical protein
VGTMGRRIALPVGETPESLHVNQRDAPANYADC